ncbi:hypothetical protein V9T40_007716 [Parthenolecanium corni]|uniref:Uncharacterized protein n=1 Tax=Parthenolecanium corni TaxID=536013 RepID=A0AAN9TY01_9HEMI
MLEPILQSVLANKKIVLASSSPRRKEILQNLKLKFDVIPSKFDEDSLDQSKYPTQKDYVLDVAKHKVEAVFEDLKSKNKLPDVIIGADSVVELNNRLFGKPKNPEEAVEFLSLLNGKPHTVHTAVVIKTPTLSKNFVESTTVHMAPLEADVIKAYVETKDPL